MALAFLAAAAAAADSRRHNAAASNEHSHALLFTGSRLNAQNALGNASTSTPWEFFPPLSIYMDAQHLPMDILSWTAAPAAPASDAPAPAAPAPADAGSTAASKLVAVDKLPALTLWPWMPVLNQSGLVDPRAWWAMWSADQLSSEWSSWWQAAQTTFGLVANATAVTMSGYTALALAPWQVWSAWWNSAVANVAALSKTPVWAAWNFLFFPPPPTFALNYTASPVEAWTSALLNLTYAQPLLGASPFAPWWQGLMANLTLAGPAGAPPWSIWFSLWPGWFGADYSAALVGLNSTALLGVPPEAPLALWWQEMLLNATAPTMSGVLPWTTWWSLWPGWFVNGTITDPGFAPSLRMTKDVDSPPSKR